MRRMLKSSCSEAGWQPPEPSKRRQQCLSSEEGLLSSVQKLYDRSIRDSGGWPNVAVIRRGVFPLHLVAYV